MTAIPSALAQRFGLESPSDQLPSCVWPGGYPVIYYDRDCDVLCPDCANRSLCDDDGFTSPVVDGDVYWEGPDEVCAECGAALPSAYGNPFCPCGATLPDDPVEIDGVDYCDKCASLCVICEKPSLLADGSVEMVDDDTGAIEFVCAACHHGAG